jgi:hypothetical protein
MANQLNYPNPLIDIDSQRPARITDVDTSFIKTGEHSIIFGVTNRDVVEIWIYNPDGSFAGHLTLPPTDPILSVASIVDNAGSVEVINLDLAAITRRTGIDIGHYSLVVNFFRDEVGSEAGYKMYITDVSSDRTELRLAPVVITQQAISDLFEFIVPSVPRQFAKGLIDQLFGKNLNPVASLMVTPDVIVPKIDALEPLASARLQTSNIYGQYVSTCQTVLDRAYPLALDFMASDVTNPNIQAIDIQKYIDLAVAQVLSEMKQRGEFDIRMDL